MAWDSLTITTTIIVQFKWHSRPMTPVQISLKSKRNLGRELGYETDDQGNPKICVREIRRRCQESGLTQSRPKGNPKTKSMNERNESGAKNAKLSTDSNVNLLMKTTFDAPDAPTTLHITVRDDKGRIYQIERFFLPSAARIIAEFTTAPNMPTVRATCCSELERWNCGVE